jgi:hypothetical protein
MFAILTAAAGTFAQSATEPASAWIEAVRILAARIVSFAPPAAVLYLDFKNLSSAEAGEASAVQRELVAELGRRGLHLATDSGQGKRLEVALSESTESYLLVARVQGPQGEQVAIAAGPPRATGAGGPAPDAVFLLRKPVWEQRRPILDFASLPSDVSDTTPLLLILQPDAMILHARPVTQWVTAQSAPLAHSAPWPRDLRGWIDLNNHKIELTGVECTGDLAKPSAVQCAATNASGKFPREMKQLPLATPIANGKQSGEGLLLDLTCGDARVALVTGAGDWTEPDSVQAYELKDEALERSGDPLAFPGPVLALWPSPDLKSARVVARNLQTGFYEASIISVTCGN